MGNHTETDAEFPRHGGKNLNQNARDIARMLSNDPKNPDPRDESIGAEMAKTSTQIGAEVSERLIREFNIGPQMPPVDSSVIKRMIGHAAAQGAAAAIVETHQRQQGGL